MQEEPCDDHYHRLLARLPSFGITRLANITGLDPLPLMTVMAVRPNACYQAITLGTSSSKKQAMTAAISEAIELFSLEYDLSADLTGSYDQLARNYPLLWPNTPYQRQQDELRKKLVQQWIQVSPLGDEHPAYLPKRYFIPHATIKNRRDEIATSSIAGIACRESQEEALSHGLFELIEQDCKMRFAYQFNHDDFRIHLDSVASKSNRFLLQEFKSAGIKLTITDLQSELCVPCYQVQMEVPVSKTKSNVKTFRGYGCDFDHDHAIEKALNEAIQGSRSYLSGCRDETDLSWYLLEIAPVINEITLTHRPEWRYVEDDPNQSILQRLKSRLQRFGYPAIYYLDRGKMAIPFHVTQVIVPGLIGSSLLCV
ncbi:YcaO-like family protein [Legionella sp. W05-934-2]|jgi:ribosomal protein S12 methylthiotransferase accessory factor|uniref:YcaO-like family protein n=1 Tax=Legionella sp. W05-934-2 TaxID=1198649 RepID=UPI00346210A9